MPSEDLFEEEADSQNLLEITGLSDELYVHPKRLAGMLGIRFRSAAPKGCLGFLRGFPKVIHLDVQRNLWRTRQSAAHELAHVARFLGGQSLLHDEAQIDRMALQLQLPKRTMQQLWGDCYCNLRSFSMWNWYISPGLWWRRLSWALPNTRIVVRYLQARTMQSSRNLWDLMRENALYDSVRHSGRYEVDGRGGQALPFQDFDGRKGIVLQIPSDD